LSGFAVGRVARFAEVGEQAADALDDALVAVDFASQQIWMPVR
jgi:hypothetical protein